MIPCVPHITEHAYRRADERLCMARDPFTAWVAATFADWLPVNAQFLTARGVVCGQAGNRFYATPWTVGRGVAFALSADHAIKTVMDFRQEAVSITRGARLAAADPPPDDPMRAAAVRVARDGNYPAAEIVRRAIGLGGVGGDMADVALADFAGERIDFQDLADVLRPARSTAAGSSPPPWPGRPRRPATLPCYAVFERSTR